MEAQRVLERIADGIPGLAAVVCLTEDGFPVVSTMDSGEPEWRTTAAGALLSEAGARGVRELDLGSLDAVITVGRKGYFVISRIGPGHLLMGIAGSRVPMGLLLLRFRKYLPALRQAVFREESHTGG